MDLIADGLLVATALTAALYCLVLSRRLRRLIDTRSGLGAKIQELNTVLEQTRAALNETRKGVAEARGSAERAKNALSQEIWVAKQMAGELERSSRAANATVKRLQALERESRPGEGQAGFDPEEDDAQPGAEVETITEFGADAEWAPAGLGAAEPDPEPEAGEPPGTQAPEPPRFHGSDAPDRPSRGGGEADPLLRVERVVL